MIALSFTALAHLAVHNKMAIAFEPIANHTNYILHVDTAFLLKMEVYVRGFFLDNKFSFKVPRSLIIVQNGIIY